MYSLDTVLEKLRSTNRLMPGYQLADVRNMRRLYPYERDEMFTHSQYEIMRAQMATHDDHSPYDPIEARRYIS